MIDRKFCFGIKYVRKDLNSVGLKYYTCLYVVIYNCNFDLIPK